MHHCLKTIQKALKQTRAQEVKVIMRRLKKAQQQAEKQGEH